MGDITYEEDNFYTENELNSSSDSVESSEVGSEGTSSITGNAESVLEIEEIENEYSMAKTLTLELDDDLEVEDSEDDLVENEGELAKTLTLDIDGLDLEVEDADDDDGEVFSPEERMRVFADNIMSCCVGDKEISAYALDKLIASINPLLFRDENYILFSVLYAYRSKLKRIHIDEEFIKLALKRNRTILHEARNLIDINAYGEIDGSVELGYISGVLKHYKRLRSMEELSEIDFNTNLEKYLIEFKTIESAKVYATSSLILTEGVKQSRKFLMGFEDSYNYVRRQLAEIDGLVEMKKGTGFTKLKDLLLSDSNQVQKSYKIGDFGKLEALNKVYGGIYSGVFYQVLAPPKAGKSKLCTRLVHNAIVNYGTNVSVWAVEGGKDAWSAQIRAIHFDYTYNTGVGLENKKYGVNQDVIVKDTFPSEELRQLELSSKIDLASNQDYGSVDLIDRPFEVETFIEDIDASVKENNSKMILIDYLQLIRSASNMNERERISEAYKSLLAYCRANNVAVLTPGQYKQDTFDQLVSKGSTNDADMRTSGGGSAEVLRTPDVIFALWATTQDLLNNSMKILSMPCRMNAIFPEINVNMDLGTCQFISVDK